MKLTRQEQETIVLYNNENAQAEIYTCDPKLIRRIEQAVQRRPGLYRITRRDPDGAVTCVFPRKWLTIQLREPISEERRQVLSKSMKNHNAARKL